ncbi:Tll0287-like domain-containing protein [Thiosocius teredinicola]|uniref:Tll0287-like domain-containing protein n=1 Tax=Thiosocius teredinicola TaxID=1973002 RepID=UPI000990A4F9
MKQHSRKNMIALTLLGAVATATGVSVAEDVADKPMISPKTMADALHLVMDSDRTVYTQKIVNRLAKKEKVITASEHFEDEKALVLPAQMFRFGSELVAKRAEKLPDVKFSYSLQSMWPVNKQNAPKTEAEKAGLKFVADNKGQNYYTVEELGGTKYFTAVYADTAVAPVCVSCHNDHKDTPRRDFKLGDVMGGVVIRIPVEG